MICRISLKRDLVIAFWINRFPKPLSAGQKLSTNDNLWIPINLLIPKNALNSSVETATSPLFWVAYFFILFSTLLVVLEDQSIYWTPHMEFHFLCPCLLCCFPSRNIYPVVSRYIVLSIFIFLWFCNFHQRLIVFWICIWFCLSNNNIWLDFIILFLVFIILRSIIIFAYKLINKFITKIVL